MFIKVDKKTNDVVESISGAYDDNAKKDILKRGFIEVSDEYVDTVMQPCKYINNAVIVNTEEIERRARDVELRVEWDAFQAKLNATDYIIIKIAEGAATTEEYADTIAERAKWRKRINEIQAELNAE